MSKKAGHWLAISLAVPRSRVSADGPVTFGDKCTTLGENKSEKACAFICRNTVHEFSTSIMTHYNWICSEANNVQEIKLSFEPSSNTGNFKQNVMHLAERKIK